MAKSEGQLDSALVESSDNVAETALAFETQSQQFKQVQNQFEDYMDRLQDDIRMKSEKFGHVEYFDAKLRDGHSNEEAVAAGEVNQLDNRRKPLAAANPLLAKQAEMPPVPKVDEITFEYLNLDLPNIAEKALKDLENSLLKLDKKLIPLQTSYTQSASGDKAGRPAMEDSEKSDKTLEKEESLDKNGGGS
jgi:hypothetical protein